MTNMHIQKTCTKNRKIWKNKVLFDLIMIMGDDEQITNFSREKYLEKN